MVKKAFCSANVTSEIHFSSIPNNRGELAFAAADEADADALAGAYEEDFSSIFSDSLKVALRWYAG
jgi:hypothetical protein